MTAAFAALWLLLAAVSADAAESPSVPVRYSFDDGPLATGPDTFMVFRNAKGDVRLSTAFHVSGYRSLEVRDVAGDGAFPELQGYFPLRREGSLAVHFAFLTTDPRQELNAALAGPGWFQLAEDGIAVWFTVRDGILRQVSDSIPKRLLAIEPFTWYSVDVDYDLGRGRYDLRVFQEGNPEPVVSLKDQPNAAAQPGAAVYVFSFIGDLADRSNVDYYVDDVVLTSDRGATPPPFVAPGRRKFFVDLFGEQASLFQRLRKPGSPVPCPLVQELADVGLASRDLAELGTAGLETLGELLGSTAGTPRAGMALPPTLRPISRWASGCAALEKGKAQEALAAFDEAVRQTPKAGIFQLSRLTALIVLERWREVDDLLAGLHARWLGDPRYALVSALAGARRGDAGEARAWLEPAALEALRQAPFVGRLAGWSALCLASEQYFHLALLEGRTAEARDYALEMAKLVAAAGAPAGEWLERAGDAAFARRDLEEARQLYGRARDGGSWEPYVLLKLADVSFLLGDLAAEKILREKFYGSLDPR